MKFVQFIGGGSVRLGIKTEKGIIDVEQCATLLFIDVPTTMEQVIICGEKALLQIKQLTMKELPYVSEEEMVYAPCITQPEKIICVALNYMIMQKSLIWRFLAHLFYSVNLITLFPLTNKKMIFRKMLTF